MLGYAPILVPEGEAVADLNGNNHVIGSLESLLPVRGRTQAGGEAVLFHERLAGLINKLKSFGIDVQQHHFRIPQDFGSEDLS